jgi:hypothetical protein
MVFGIIKSVLNIGKEVVGAVKDIASGDVLGGVGRLAGTAGTLSGNPALQAFGNGLSGVLNAARQPDGESGANA